MVSRDDMPEGSARLVLASGVALIRPEEAMLEAMLTGWARQQYGGRGLGRSCVEGRIGVVRRFVVYTNEFPWNWTSAMVDEWSAHLLGELHRAKSTLQQTQGALELFCEFLIDPRYGLRRIEVPPLSRRADYLVPAGTC